MLTEMKQISPLQVKTVKEHLDKQISKWTKIMNTHYETDGGNDLKEYTRGALRACTELKAFIEHEEQYGKSE